MPDEHRGRLDRAIDRAVRDMVQADPRPGLRHRVVDRIEAPSTSGSLHRVGWQLAALATAAVLVVALGSLVLLRSPETPASRDPRVAAVEPAPAPIVPSAATPAPASEAATQSAREAGVARPAQAPPVSGRQPRSSDNIFGDRRGLVRAADATAPPNVDPSLELAPWPAEPPPAAGALAPLAPITIAPIRVTPISVSPIVVNALPGRK